MSTTKPPVAINVQGHIIHCTDYSQACKLAQSYANITRTDIGVFIAPYTRYERMSTLITPEKVAR